MRALSIGLPARCRPSWVVQALEVAPSSFSSLTRVVLEPSSTKRWKMWRTSLASAGFGTRRRFSTSYPRGGTPPIHIPLRLLAAILSRMRSPVTSRSNWAKRQQDVQHQPAHRGRGVELLGDRDEGHPVALEHLDHLGEVGEASGQAVDLVDDHDVHLAGLDVRQQAFEGRAVHVAPGVGGVVVVVRDRNPALRALAGDVGMARVALGVDGVVLLVQPLVGGLAGVDGAAQAALQDVAHRRDPFFLAGFFAAAGALSPKNSGPDHRVPVISRAIIERLG